MIKTSSPVTSIWSVTAVLSIVSGNGRVAKYKLIPLYQGLVTFGRALSNRVTIESLQISRHHASFKYRNGVWFLKDTSTNGISVNIIKCLKNEWTELSNGDVICFIPNGLLQYRINYKSDKAMAAPSAHIIEVVDLESDLDNTLETRSDKSTITKSTSTILPCLSGPMLSSNVDKLTTAVKVESEDNIHHHQGVIPSLILDGVDLETELEITKISKRIQEQNLEEGKCHKRFCAKSPHTVASQNELLELREENYNLIKTVDREQAEQYEREMTHSEYMKSHKTSLASRLHVEIDFLTKKCNTLESEKISENLKFEERLRDVNNKMNCVTEELFKKILGCLEADFGCSICSEVFIEATVLSCGHTFCGACISEWIPKKLECPICRKVIISKSKHIEIGNFVNKVYEFMPDDVKFDRKKCIRERGGGRHPRNTRYLGIPQDRYTNILVGLAQISNLFGRGPGNSSTGSNPGNSSEVDQIQNNTSRLPVQLLAGPNPTLTRSIVRVRPSILRPRGSGNDPVQLSNVPILLLPPNPSSSTANHN